MSHIFSGFIDDVGNFKKDDIVYIYGGGDKRVEKKKNGICAIGTVRQIICDDDENGKNYKFAMIKIDKRGFPIIDGSKYFNEFFKPYLCKANWQYGCYELIADRDKEFLCFMNKKIEEFIEVDL